jgi:hypothetical protein
MVGRPIMKLLGKIKTQKYQLKDGTKTSYELIEEKHSDLTEDVYNNLTSPDTLRFFRRLGGSEYVEKCYTSRGYRVFRMISKSPCRGIKTVRTFDFY